MSIKNFLKRLLIIFKKEKSESPHTTVLKSKKTPKREIPDFCEFNNCKTKLNILNSKQCKYCRNYFCITHLAPAEKHNCKGKLIRPPGQLREIYSGGKIIATSE